MMSAPHCTVVAEFVALRVASTSSSDKYGGSRGGCADRQRGFGPFDEDHGRHTAVDAGEDFL